jgi:hypothetical protein
MADVSYRKSFYIEIFFLCLKKISLPCEIERLLALVVQGVVHEPLFRRLGSEQKFSKPATTKPIKLFSNDKL